MDEKVITLDVREEIRSGGEPFSRIMNAVTTLRADEQLQLIAPFEPVPLFHIMRKLGFTHFAKPISSGDWEVLFTRDQQPQASDGNGKKTSPLHVEQSTSVEVDARGLEPPQPMIKILEVLSNISPGGELVAHTDRRPMHLYAQLEARGFVGQTEEQFDGSFLTHIRPQ